MVGLGNFSQPGRRSWQVTIEGLLKIFESRVGPCRHRIVLRHFKTRCLRCLLKGAASHKRKRDAVARYLGSLGVLIVVMAASSAFGADRESSPITKTGVYCVNQKRGLTVFADKLLPNGDLAVGFSDWYPNGHHIGFFGTAVRKGNHWEYTSDMDARDPADHCKAYIRSRPDGTPFIAGDALAKCQASGDVGTEIRSIGFHPSAYEGPVTNELADSETFFNAGKCGR